ncbi:alpha-amylase family glycosyl hydrolase [Spirosoma gilvum]
MVNTIDCHQRSLGLTFTPDHTARISVWAPFAQKVGVSNQNNSVEIPLQRDAYGYWQAETDQIRPGDLYTFILNDEQECADPASLIQPQGFFGPSQAFDTSAFYWEDAHWINPPIDEYIIYELDICTFTPEGILKALIHKLNYLKKLGVTAILLRPVTPFLNTGNAQQVAPFLYAVQAPCGGPAHLQQLVNACHFEGIAVILDLVYHRSEQPTKGFENFGLLARSQNRVQDTAKPMLTRDVQERYLIENVLMWFRDFHIDAVQLTDSQTLPNADQLLHQMRDYTSTLTRITGRQYYLLAEHDLAAPLASHEKQATDPFMGQVSPEEVADTTSIAIDQAILTRRCHTRHYQESYLYDSHFSDVLHDLFDREGANGPGEAVLSISQNCYKSQSNLMEAYPSQSLNTEFIKLMAGYIMVSPCVPTLFMGEEWGRMNPFHALAHRESVPAGSAPESLLADTGNSSASALTLDMLDDQPNPILYQYYQSLTALRRQQPALYHLNPKQTRTIYQGDRPTLLLHRSYKTNEVLCLINFSSEKQSVTLPSLDKNWKKLLDSSDPVWDGPGASPESLANAATITLQPESIVVYKAQS